MKLNFIPMPRRSPAAMIRSLSTVAFVAFALAVPRVCQADMLKFHVDFGDTSTLGSDYSLFTDLANNTGDLNSTTLHFQNFTGQANSIPNFDISDSISFVENPTPFVTGSSTAPSPFGFDILADFTPPTNPQDADQFVLFFGANDQSAHPDTGNLFTITFNSSTIGGSNGIGYSTHSNTGPNVPAPTVTVSTVLTPEPSTWAMMAMGLGALFFLARKKRQSAQEPVPATVLA